MSTPSSLVASSFSLSMSCRWRLQHDLVDAAGDHLVDDRLQLRGQQVHVVDLDRPSPGSPFFGKPLTSVPVGEEMRSRICVVAPTMPIFSPPSVTVTQGAILPLMVEASSPARSPAVPPSEVSAMPFDRAVVGEVEIGGDQREVGAGPGADGLDRVGVDRRAEIPFVVADRRHLDADRVDASRCPAGPARSAPSRRVEAAGSVPALRNGPGMKLSPPDEDQRVGVLDRRTRRSAPP